MSDELESEQKKLRKVHETVLEKMQREFESEKQLKKEKFAMELSKFMKGDNKSLDKNEEKREIEV